MSAIKINNFHKQYDSVKAVQGIDLEVERAELFGLIGPDGAGKTTLMQAICTLLLPDEGSILVNGLDVTKNIAQIRSILGYMPQRFSLYQDLSVEQNLKFFADLFQVPVDKRGSRLSQLYQFSRLGPFKKRKAAALSGGMKQKLALSCALIHTPEILVLDEPTYGVDPVSRQEFWQILHSIRSEGTTILASTAYMEEADQCDRVALFYESQIVGLDTPEKLKDQYPYPLFQLRGNDLRELKHYFDSVELAHSTQLFGDTLHVSFKEMPTDQNWQAWQKSAKGNLQDWVKQSPSIEDVFLDLIQNRRGESGL